MITHILLILPIHKRSYKDYYDQHNEYVRIKKADIESQWNRPFDQLGLEQQVMYENSWFWPPWIFNDSIGFLKIGADSGACLLGEIYLKRKHFPRSNKIYHLGTTLRKQEIVYYTEIQKHAIEFLNNETYVQAANDIIQDAQIIIIKIIRKWHIWLPNYDISCLNMAEAHQQMIKKKKNNF